MRLARNVPIFVVWTVLLVGTMCGESRWLTAAATGFSIRRSRAVEHLVWVFSEGQPNDAFWRKLGEAVKDGYLDWVLIPIVRTETLPEPPQSARVLFRG